MNYKQFYVLGDSLSDTGAFTGILSGLLCKNVCFPSPFYEGRSFSNGLLAVEYVANKLNLPLKPGWRCDVPWKSSEQIGTNYAISNASATLGTSFPYKFFFNKFQLKNQLNTLIKHHSDIGEDDLVLIMIGGNDVMNAVVDESNSNIIINGAVAEIYNTLVCLATNNVKHIVVSNVPDIGLIPAFINREKQELATDLTIRFNTGLASKIEAFKKQYFTVNIKSLDLISILKEIIDNYHKKGHNTYDACISDIADHLDYEALIKLIFKGKIGEAEYNPGCSKEKICNYLFFDYFHPTQRPHQIVGGYLYKLIIT